MPENVKITVPRSLVESTHLYIAVPCYDNSVTEPFMMSLIRTLLNFREIGLRATVATMSDSLISRSRNALTARFMGNQKATHMLFIDSDIEFKPEHVMKLLWHDKDIAVGAYPVKELQLDAAEKKVHSGMPLRDALHRSARFAINAVVPGQETISLDKGAVTILDAATGFMLIKRGVIERMIEAYPELRYLDDTQTLSVEEKKYAYAFFNSYIDDDGRFLSEDYGFSRYWQKIGGTIWLDPSLELTHVGRYRYTGSPAAYINSFVEEEIV